MSEDERKPMANITPFGLRMQPDLKARIEASARENNRSINAEIVERLEESFSNHDGYRDLAELAIESMRANAENSRREVEEYREMVGTIRIYRYIIDRLKNLVDGELPEYLALFLSALNPLPPATEEEMLGILEGVAEAIEKRDRIVAEQASAPPDSSHLQRIARLEGLVGRIPDTDTK